MEECEENMSAEDIKDFGSPSYKVRPKKRSLVERELETNLTERITSPIVSDSFSTSRYGRARRLKTESEHSDSQKVGKSLKSPQNDKSPVKSPVYKMHASNSPIRVESPVKIKIESNLDHQIESIYNENKSLSRFGEEKNLTSPVKQQKVYVRKDLIQSKEKDASVASNKNNYSPVKSSKKSNSHLSNVLERSSDCFSLNSKNSFLNNSSVVKTLDFDNNKKKIKDNSKVLSKSDLFELEAKCEYQVGDLAWAKMGTFPYWPCIITRDPYSGMFVKKKLFGRVDRDVIHVTFFGDNGRRSWIVDNMLRKFLGQLEFEATREKFTPEAKKKDPRCAAFFVSEKKMPQWTLSVEEAETLLREPKRLRIDLLNDMLNKARAEKTTPKGRKVTRTDSDVSLSESLYDTLFSEDDSKTTESDQSKANTRKKSLDVSEVVTACLDNMAAKTGMTKIKKQSHMDRWLQKAKSKTPEKSQFKSQKQPQTAHNRKKSKSTKRETDLKKPFRFTTSDNESLSEVEVKLQSHQSEHDYSTQKSVFLCDTGTPDNNFGEIAKMEGLSITSDNELVINAHDGELIMSDDCIVGEETVVASEDVTIHSNGIDNVVISDIKTIPDNTGSITSVSSTIDQNLDDGPVLMTNPESQLMSSTVNKNCNNVFETTKPTIVVENQLMSSNVSKILNDDPKSESQLESSTVSKNLDDDPVSINDSENQLVSIPNDDIISNNNLDKEDPTLSDFNMFNINKDTGDKIFHEKQSENKSTKSTIDILSNLMKEHNEEVVEEVNSKQKIQDSYNINKDMLNEEATNGLEWSSKNTYNVTVDDDQDKQDVNIAKTILSDKLVGNRTVESNKTECINEVNEVSVDENFSLNDDSDLTISETTGVENRSMSDESDKINNDVETESSMNDKFYVNSEIMENNSSTDDSQFAPGKNVFNKEISFGLDIPLISTVHKTGSDIFYEDNTQLDREKSEESDIEFISSSKTRKFISKPPKVLINGFAHNSDDLTESDSTRRNSDSYSSFGDDERSSNSTPSSLKKKSTVNKGNKNRLRLIRKIHRRFKNAPSSDTANNDDTVRSTLDNEGLFPCGNISQPTTTEDSESGSTESKECDSDNKSTYSDEQTESTETTGIMDVDEPTSDTVIQNGYHEPDKEDYEDKYINKNITALHVDLSKEKAIMDGDELRLTPNGFEIMSDNGMNKITEINEEKVEESASDTVSVMSSDSELSLTTDNVKQIDHFDLNRKLNVVESQSAEKTTSPLTVDLSKQEVVMNGDALRLTPSLPTVNNENSLSKDVEIPVKQLKDEDAASVVSTDSEVSLSKRKMRWKLEKQNIVEKKPAKNMEDPEFLKYLELKQDEIYDEHPEFTQEEITTYLYNTFLYEHSLKTDSKKIDDIESANMVKGLQSEVIQQKEVRKRVKVKKEKDLEPVFTVKEEIIPKNKPKRRTVRPSYNEEYSDIESDLEVFTIFKPKRTEVKVVTKTEDGLNAEAAETTEIIEIVEEEEIDEVEEYFRRLAEPKPNVFKGLLRERVCEICEKTGNLIKCKGCSCMFHENCAKKQTEVVEAPSAPVKGRKKKKKYKSRKSKTDENGVDEGEGDEKDANVSEELNSSLDNIESESHVVADADEFEAKLALKMKELLGETDNVQYESFSSDDELDWSDTEPGKCEVVEIKLRKKSDELTDYSDFKCNNCQKYDVPICFVCRSAESPKNSALHRQRCQVPHCNKYYHLECLEHWPQTQFNSGECARYNKKINEYFEALTCPRHVCHTCVSDDPRGCKTRFSGDKLAKCVRCPATYHSFTKCLPAGTQILTGSHIVCPRHYEHRPGKVPCHVNTGWCFICALGGTLICCEYCPTSFHAECLNIKPPEGSYMCEDCETGRLPLYGEMVWVKLGHYRWWPGIILHPCEIPENIMAVKHSPGEFVVRFFGQYDHYWVNRGRVFPFQEGDSGKVSSQKSKIDAAFTMAMEHASRACEILKNATENEEESLDIASSLLPPHYVKLKANKPCGALCGRRIEPQESSLTQCDCDPNDAAPCGPYSHCLNRMLLTECGPTCRAGDRCNNRAFEKRQYPKLVPYRAPHRGWGLKTLEEIKAGQFVIEYVGELIDEEEFQRRMRRKHEIRDENFYFLTLDKERMIDAGPKGNLARFMNHCCEPNCETQKWTVLGDVRVGLFALYDIPANSEVTFNYNLESAGIEKKRCLCGAKRCSGYIGAKPKQADQPKKNKLPGKRTYKKRKVEDSPSTSTSTAKVKPKPRLGRPPKPKELTEIEKDLLIIKNATNGLSSDSDCSVRLTSIDSKILKRKIGFTEEPSCSNSPSKKKMKVNDEKCTEICD